MIDWTAIGTMLLGIGAVMGAVVAALTLAMQWGAREKLKKVEPELAEKKLQFKALGAFQTFYASPDGMPLSYPEDEDVIVEAISSHTGMDKETLKRHLWELDQMGLLEVRIP